HDGVAVVVAYDTAVDIQRDGRVTHDGRQFAALEREVLVVCQSVARSRWCDLVNVLVKLFERSVLLDQGLRGLLSDSRNSWDVVGLVADERLVLRQSFWSEPVALNDRLPVEQSVFSEPLCSGEYRDGVVVHE